MTTKSDKVQFFEVPSPLPVIPEDAERDAVKQLLTEYALQNNFILTTCKSRSTLMHLKCKKGGEYKNWRNLKEEDRKRFKTSTRIGCPYYIRVGKTRKNGFHYLKSVSDDEHLHNHTLDLNEERVTTITNKKRKKTSKQEREEEKEKKAKEEIEKRLPTKKRSRCKMMQQ